MTALPPSASGASIEDFCDEALITEAVRRGLIGLRLEDWSPRARRVLVDMEWTKTERMGPLHPFGLSPPNSTTARPHGRGTA